jgi:hypothetical protein
MCSHAGDGDGYYQDGISMYGDTGLRRHLYGTLNGWVGGDFVLTVRGMLTMILRLLTLLAEATNEHPFFLLSPRSHYFLGTRKCPPPPPSAHRSPSSRPGPSHVRC